MKFEHPYFAVYPMFFAMLGWRAAVQKTLQTCLMAVGSLVLGSTYGIAIALLDGWLEHAATVIFLGLLIAAFVFLTKRIFANQHQTLLNTTNILLICIGLHVGILGAFQLCHGPQTAIWVADSYQMHVPGSWDISWVIKGIGDWPSKAVSFDRVYFTHLVAGVFFALLGASPLASGIALLCLKLLTIVLILRTGERLFNRETALLAALTYCLAPTVLFYTVAFYKEAAVQFAVLLATYSIIRLIFDHKFWFFPVACLSLGLLFNERPYLFPMFAGTLVLAVLLSRKVHWIFKVSVIGLGLAGAHYFMSFYGDLFTFQLVFREIAGYQLAFNSYPDVDPALNMGLPYPLAVVKILLTPFFTLQKFELFDNFSFLLIWGSFIHQMITVLAVYGLWKFSRKHWQTLWVALLPFACFIGLFAYIAPYNGRLRDSFYPLLSLLFAYGVKCWSDQRWLAQDKKRSISPANLAVFAHPSESRAVSSLPKVPLEASTLSDQQSTLPY